MESTVHGGDHACHARLPFRSGGEGARTRHRSHGCPNMGAQLSWTWCRSAAGAQAHAHKIELGCCGPRHRAQQRNMPQGVHPSGSNDPWFTERCAPIPSGWAIPGVW